MTDYSAPTSRAVRTGHYIEAAVVPFVLAQLALISASVLWETGALRYISVATLIAYGAAAAIWWPRHGRGLCEVCFAAFPLNAPEEATRIRRWLRLTHTVDDAAQRVMRALRVPRRALAQMTVAAVIGAVVSLLMVLVSPWLAIALMAGAAVALRAALLHQRFAPWCPWCRRGDGDDEEVPEPEPDPSMYQTV